MVTELIRRTEDLLRHEQELLDRLRAVEPSAPSGWQGVLRIVELLHGLDSPSAARRQQAALAPAEDGPVPTEALARAVLAEADPNVAGALRWALARAGDEGVASVAAGMRSAEVDVRRRAVLAIAELPGDQSTVLLTSALDDPDPAVRGPAALAAGRRGAREAVPILVDMIVEGTNDVEASEVLGALGTGSILGALTEALATHHTDQAVRIRLVQALAELPPSLARDTLRELTQDHDRTVAAIAAALAERE
jgi:hypothetical protein